MQAKTYGTNKVRDRESVKVRKGDKNTKRSIRYYNLAIGSTQ